jgi:uncharacterized protein YjbI with pentapeptide repeats
LEKSAETVELREGEEEMLMENKLRKKAAPRWTGFSNKTLWDWLALLAIPLAVVLGLLWLGARQSQTDFLIAKAMAEQQHQTGLQIAKDQQQEAALSTYLDQMSALILNNNLRHSAPSSEIRQIARDRTIAVLLRMDPARKGIVLLFLYGSELIMRGDAIINLSGADLTGAKLRDANLAGAELAGANLTRADLTGANLFRTDLSGTPLNHATMPDGSVNP